MVAAAELAELGVRPASAIATEAASQGVDRILPVLPTLRALLPGGLVRGSTVAVTTRGSGATSLLLALLAEPTRTGSWCAVIGLPSLSLAAAAAIGVNLQYLALVPQPGPDAAAVAATMLDGFDVVALATPGALAPSVCSQLSARARNGRSALVALTQWPAAQLTLSAEGGTWFGRGRLRCRRLTIAVSGRGSAARPRREQVWLPADPEFQQRTADLAPAHPPQSRHLQVVA